MPVVYFKTSCALFTCRIYAVSVNVVSGPDQENIKPDTKLVSILSQYHTRTSLLKSYIYNQKTENNFPNRYAQMSMMDNTVRYYTTTSVRLVYSSCPPRAECAFWDSCICGMCVCVVLTASFGPAALPHTAHNLSHSFKTHTTMLLSCACTISGRVLFP